MGPRSPRSNPNATPHEAESGSIQVRASASRSPRAAPLTRPASRERSPGASAATIAKAEKRRRRREQVRNAAKVARERGGASDAPKLDFAPGHESVSFSQETPVARQVTLATEAPPDRRTLGRVTHPTLAERSPTPAARANSPLADPRGPLPALTFPGEGNSVVPPSASAAAKAAAKAAGLAARAKADARRKAKGKGKDKGKGKGKGKGKVKGKGRKGRGAASSSHRSDQSARKAEQGAGRGRDQ